MSTLLTPLYIHVNNNICFLIPAPQCRGRNLGNAITYMLVMSSQNACEKFEVLMAESVKITAFKVLGPKSLVEVYRRFGGNCYLRHQGECGGSKHL